MAPPADALHQAVAMKHGVNGALGGDSHVPVELANQELADLACTPMRLLALEVDDHSLDLRRQLIRITHGAAGPIAERLKAALLVAIEDLVAGLTGDAECQTGVRHRLPFK